MRTRFAALVGALLVPFLLRGVASAEDAAQKVVTDKEHDFAWTLPSAWEVVEPSASDRESGYHAKAKRPVSAGVECTANVFVKPAGGATLDTFVSMMKDNKLKVLTETEVDENDVSWAGAAAKAVTILGKAENGSSVKWFVRAAVVGDNYHQVSVMSVNAAHADVGSEIDEVLAGYRVLSAPAAADGAGAPANAMKREFPNVGLTWTLPEGGERKAPPVKDGDPERVWKWGFAPQGNPGLERGQNGLLAAAVLTLNDAPLIVAELTLPKVDTADIPPAGIVKNDGNFDDFAKQNFDGTPIPNIDADCKVGNARGAYYSLSGKANQDGRPLFFRFYFVTLQQQLYRLLITAHEGAETSESDFMKALVNGLAWADTTVGIRGPLLAPFQTATSDRKNWRDLGKKREIVGSVNLKKPPQFGELSVSGAQGYLFAAEVRKPGAYLFVAIIKDSAEKIGKGSPPFTLQSMIDKHENDWKTDLANPDTRGKGEKANSKDGSFKNGKGHTYEFRGEKDGFPFLEKGWVVKAGKDIVWIRAQYGGKDAEKTLAGDWKDLQNTINFK